MEIFYFAPHQDDELTNLGPAICRDLTNGESVHVVLLTDGGASGVKRMLSDGGGCLWHAGAHTHALSPAGFTAARDREFTESCLALGVPEENIRVSPLRAPDGALTPDAALAAMREAVKRYPANGVCVKTLAPGTGARQNPDHTAAGLAAKALFAAGGCAALTLTYEFIHLPPEGAPAGTDKIIPNADEARRIKKAAAAYTLWAPENGRYAVGYHSVADEFNEFLKNPVCVIFKRLSASSAL